MQVIIDIINAIGVPLVLKLISGTTPQETVMAILEAEYKAAEEAAKLAEHAKFG